VPGGGAVNDADWLKIRNNGVPYSITDSIYTLKTVSINGRNYFPDVELNVYDSTSTAGATVAAIGNRGGRFAGFNTVSGAWSSFGQEGSLAQIYGGAGTTSFVVSEVTGTAPGNPSGTFAPHFEIDFVNDNVKLNKYPNSRNDAGLPVNVLTTSATGVVESHSVSEMFVDSISTCYEYQGFVYGVKTSPVVNVLLLGDSRTENPYTPDELMRRFQARFGYAGFGGFSIASQCWVGYWDKNVSGETIADNAGNGLLSPIGYASNIAAAGYVEFVPKVAYQSTNKFTSVDFWYTNPSGSTLTVTIDGVSVGTVTATTTVPTIASFSGFSDLHHTIRITNSGASSASLYEINFKRDGVSGVRFHRLGNSGEAANQLVGYTANTYFYSSIAPQLTYIRIGVNDMGGTAATFKTNIESIALAIKGVVPGGIAFINETDNLTANQANVVPFNIAIRDLSEQYNYGIIDLERSVSNWTDFRTRGYAPAGDAVHENAAGGIYLGTAIFGKLFDPTCRTNKDLTVTVLAGQVTGPTTATVIGANTIGSANIVNGSVALADFAPGVATGNLFIWDGTNWVHATSNDVLSNATAFAPYKLFWGSPSGGLAQSSLLSYDGVFRPYSAIIQDVTGGNVYTQRKNAGTNLHFEGIGTQLGKTAVDYAYYNYSGSTYWDNAAGTALQIAANRSILMPGLAAYGASHTQWLSRNPATGELAVSTGTPITALAAVGSSPNANAATITGSTLNLEPASATHKGVISLTQLKFPLKMTVVDGNTDVPGAGLQTYEVIRIPAAYDGYSISDVSYGVYKTGATGTAEMQIRRNGSGTAGVTWTAGQAVKDVTLTGVTVSTGDLIDVEIISNSMATPQQGLWVTIFLTPH